MSRGLGDVYKRQVVGRQQLFFLQKRILKLKVSLNIMKVLELQDRMLDEVFVLNVVQAFLVMPKKSLISFI